MKKGLLYIIVLVIVSCSNETTKPINSNWNVDEFVYSVQDGDVVFKMGYGLISKMISKQLDEDPKVSHCAIVCKKDSAIYLLHSISGKIGPSDGVQKILVQDFFKDIKPNSLFVMRHNSGVNKRAEISNEALKLFEKRIPFDLDFNQVDNDKMYCSEFVEETLKIVYNKKFFKTKALGRNEVYTFSSLINHVDFKRVI